MLSFFSKTIAKRTPPGQRQSVQNEGTDDDDSDDYDGNDYDDDDA